MSYKKSMFVGALVGFTVAMLRKGERQAFAKDSKVALEQLKFLYDHPANVIDELKNRLTQINDRTIKVMDQLNQLEDLFNKDQKKL
ncbi:hypothetical protein ACLIA0_12230 [Bacillaceae bacterium W0354]